MQLQWPATTDKKRTIKKIEVNLQSAKGSKTWLLDSIFVTRQGCVIAENTAGNEETYGSTQRVS